MKVLIINQHKQDVIGGSEIQCDIIARYLQESGHEVAYLAVNSNRNSSDYNVDYKIYPTQSLSFSNMLRVLNEYKPDIIYWRYNKKNLLKTGILSRLKGIKIVFSIAHINDVSKWVPKYKNNSVFNVVRNIKHLFIGRINYLGFCFVDGVVSLNKNFLDNVPKNIEHKIYVRNSMESKTTSDFIWEKPYVVWVANIKKPKNPEVYINLAKKFEDDNSIDFLMIGNIQDENYNYIRDKENLPSNLYYLGPKSPEEVNSVLKNSLFLIHTCNPEGFPNNFIQAWLQEKPTITLHYDPDNTIKKNNIGFHSKNTVQLYDDVLHYVNNPEQGKRDGERARKFAVQEYSPKKNVTKLEDFLLSLLK